MQFQENKKNLLIKKSGISNNSTSSSSQNINDNEVEYNDVDNDTFSRENLNSIQQLSTSEDRKRKFSENLKQHESQKNG